MHHHRTHHHTPMFQPYGGVQQSSLNIMGPTNTSHFLYMGNVISL